VRSWTTMNVKVEHKIYIYYAT